MLRGWRGMHRASPRPAAGFAGLDGGFDAITMTPTGAYPLAP